jgi:hypothetical protein
MRQYNVNVICKTCHRISVMELIKIVPEEEINQHARCPVCDVKGSLVYLSSIGKKHQFH